MSCRIVVTLAAMLAALIFSRPAWSDPHDLRTLHQKDQLVTDIGYRLAVANKEFCSENQLLLGFSIHDLTQYPSVERQDARTIFGFRDRPLVLAVAPSSRAASAGLRVGDELRAIDRQAVSATAISRGPASFAGTKGLLDRLEQAVADGHLLLDIRRGEHAMTIDVSPEMGCPTRFFVNPDDSIQSRADGTYVQINSGMIRFAGTHDQVAAMLAHEFAHNILRHRVRLNAAGIRRGIPGQSGRSARLVRQTEEEADRLSVYLMDNAGYSPEAIVAFWTRYRSANPLSFLAAPTHAGPGDRIALVRAEIESMKAMKAAGAQPRPGFMTGDTLPALR
jgi:beta-barrel assembly-enhancing protease